MTIKNIKNKQNKSKNKFKGTNKKYRSKFNKGKRISNSSNDIKNYHLLRNKIRNQLIKEGYKPTYYLDSCFIIDAESEKRGVYMNEFIDSMTSLGIHRDSAINENIKKDYEYLKSIDKVYDSSRCMFDYNIPLNFNPENIKPFLLLHWKNSYMDKIDDRRLFTINCVLSNILNYDKLVNILFFHKLYDNMMEKYPIIAKKHMKPTFLITEKHKFKFPKMYILMVANNKIYVSFYKKIIFTRFVSNKQELEESIKLYKENDFELTDILATEYILNPVLYKKKKTHILMHYLISYINGEVNSFMYHDEGRIFTAEEEYNTEKPFHTDVHNSYPGGTRREVFFPSEVNNENNTIKPKLDINSVISQMQTCLCAVTSLLKPSKEFLYDNQKHGYMSGSAEFIIDDTGNVFLVGINQVLHLMFYTPSSSHTIIDKLYRWFHECVYEPCFAGTDAKKHKTYLPPP